MTIVKLCVLIAVHLVVFLLPGAAIVTFWRVRLGRGRTEQIIAPASPKVLFDFLAILVASGVVAYASFFPYVVQPLLGRIVSLVVLGGSVLLFVVSREARLHLRTLIRHGDVMTPLLLALTIGALYTGSTLLYGGEVHPSLVANSRYRDPLPPDNILPRLVADRVVDGVRGEPFMGDWLSSDRPPLQAGVATLSSPLIPKGSRELSYQALATMLQLLVLPAGWVLLRRLRVSYVSTLGVVTATALSGTLALHSTYVWPKLLSAAYSLLLIAVLVPSDGVAVDGGDVGEEHWGASDEGIGGAGAGVGASLSHVAQTRSRSLVTDGTASSFPVRNVVLAGGALGLSFAAHGGALFVALPLCCVLTVFGFWGAVKSIRSFDENGSATMPGIGRQPNYILRSWGLALMVSALLFAPWYAYQRVVAPPGNRLLKWHLAGVVDIDKRSLSEALIDAYTKPPFKEIVANKSSNVRELVNPARFLADVLPIRGSDDSIDRVRQREFGSLGNAVSISLIGVVAGLMGWLVRLLTRIATFRAVSKQRKSQKNLGQPSSPDPRSTPSGSKAFGLKAQIPHRRSREFVVGLWGLSIGTFATLLWCITLFGPRATLPHQGSLAVPLVLIGSSALLAASAHTWALAAFVGLSAYKVTRVWILAGPLSPERSRSGAALGMVLFGFLALFVVVAQALRRAQEQDQQDQQQAHQQDQQQDDQQRPGVSTPDPKSNADSESDLLLA